MEYCIAVFVFCAYNIQAFTDFAGKYYPGSLKTVAQILKTKLYPGINGVGIYILLGTHRIGSQAL